MLGSFGRSTKFLFLELGCRVLSGNPVPSSFPRAFHIITGHMASLVHNVLFPLQPGSSFPPNSLPLVSWTQFPFCFFIFPPLLLMLVYFLIVSCHIAVVYAHRAHRDATYKAECLTLRMYRVQNDAEAYI